MVGLLCFLIIEKIFPDGHEEKEDDHAQAKHQTQNVNTFSLLYCLLLLNIWSDLIKTLWVVNVRVYSDPICAYLQENQNGNLLSPHLGLVLD